MRLRILCITALAGSLAAPGAWAAPMPLTATDTGFVTSTGGASKFDGLLSSATYNYSAGWELICPGGGLCSSFVYGEKKSYFVFDVSSVGAPVIDATLVLGMAPDPTPGAPPDEGGYTSPDASETYIVSGTGVPLSGIDKLKEPTAPAEITSEHIGTAAAVFSGITDLFDGPGVTFGSVDLEMSDEGSAIPIVLSPEGVGYVNDAIMSGSALVFGGKVTSLTGDSAGPAEEVFSFSDSPMPTATLVVTTVPLPAGLWLLGGALVGLGTVTRRSHR